MVKDGEDWHRLITNNEFEKKAKRFKLFNHEVAPLIYKITNETFTGVLPTTITSLSKYSLRIYLDSLFNGIGMTDYLACKFIKSLSSHLYELWQTIWIEIIKIIVSIV